MGTLAGKTLFITGASRGIGLAIALRAARDGANVAIAAKSDVPNPKLPGTIHTAAYEIEAAGGEALPPKVDIRDEARVAEAAAAIAMLGGRVKPENCRKPAIVADAAHAILCRSAREFTGHFCIDDEVLREAGVTDFDTYAVVPGQALAPDLFLD